MKKVLIITYHFPPDAAVGAVRPAKFAKYLPEFGWEPIIYTVKDKFYETLDLTKYEEELKNTKIYRTNLIPGPLKLYSSLIHKGIKSPPNSVLPQLIKTNNQDGVGYIKRFLSSMVRLPDDKQGWIVNIVMEGYRILKKHKIDTFITTGPPMSTHVGGLLLKGMTHAKWVADFRDPWWTGCHWKEGRYYTQLSKAIEKWLETQTIQRADTVVTTTQSLADQFRLILPEPQRNKCITITNGFDESDFIGIRGSISNESPKIKVSHTGTLYLNRNPEPFFTALNQLVKSGKTDKDHIEIELIGNCAYYGNVSVQNLIEKYELSSVVRLIGMMPFQKSLERLMSSDALLLFAQGQPDQIPGKVFEYLKINKPIFAITGEGETKRLLEEFENAYIADPNNIGKIANNFSKMIESIENNQKYLVSMETIRKYDRRFLTEILAKTLDEIN